MHNIYYHVYSAQLYHASDTRITGSSKPAPEISQGISFYVTSAQRSLSKSADFAVNFSLCDWSIRCTIFYKRESSGEPEVLHPSFFRAEDIFMELEVQSGPNFIINHPPRKGICGENAVSRRQQKMAFVHQVESVDDVF